MKKILFLLNILALGLLVSCNSNDLATFDDKDAFVAFDKATFSISEDGGVLSVPVTLASVQGLQAQVTVAGVDGKAKNGVDYNLKNGGVVSFDANTRTANVEIEIINRAGEYTGDLTFSLEFSNLGGVNAGYQNTASVTIQDNDHPLSPILGDYTASTQSGRGEFAGYTVTLEKDPADVSKVWISNLDPYFGSFGYIAPDYNYIYGVVNSDLTQISVPCGQKIGYDNVAFVVCDDNFNAVYEGNIILKIDLVTNTINVIGMWGVDDAGWWNYYDQTVLVKK